MKLSNKILIGFFGFIFIYLTAAFAEVRFRGTPDLIDDDSNSLAETVDISGVTYLVLQDLGKNINVIGSDQARIEVRSISGDLLKKLKYNISGDTLILPQFDLEDIDMKVSVYVNNLTGMIVNGAVVTIEALDQEELSISQSAGRIRMTGKNSIGHLHVEASEMAYFEMVDAAVDTLSTKVNSSEVFIYSPVRILKGSMKNSSYIQMHGLDEIQFKKDESSTLHFY